ncbi:multivesicular body subunit 12B [Hetaerina americana]|uniref:multivesicular body subunit 12B n=1 Tax=Hetaerina americana TaxID=62018 RepID=UPI003A7F5631
MMHQVYSTLPDDRPITAIGIVSDPDKCPPGYIVVSRTHDQDSDADLWREGFFGRKTRYICLSKTEGIGGIQFGGNGPPPPPATDYIVQSVIIINDKEMPPDGYSLLPRTIDSEQKAWRKRQLCYRLAKRNLASCAVTDIIVLSRSKKAPEGFTRAGEINGLTLCYKVINMSDDVRNPHTNSDAQSVIPNLGYGLRNVKGVTPSPPMAAPNGFGPIHATETNSPSPPSAARRVPIHPSTSPPESHEYEILSAALRPTRPAPTPPLVPLRPPPPVPQVTPIANTYANSKNYATLNAYQGLEGVPFILNPNFVEIADPQTLLLPAVKPKTKYQLEQEFTYDFRIERQT